MFCNNIEEIGILEFSNYMLFIIMYIQMLFFGNKALQQMCIMGKMFL